MTKKQIGRGIAFVLVVCLLLVLLCEIFELGDTTYIATRFTTFSDLSEDTLDAVWIGTSGVDRYWLAAKAYEEYGMTVYPLSSDAMPSWLFTIMIDEIYSKQNPELIIVDLRAFAQSNATVSMADTRARRILDAMDAFSINRFKVAFKTMKVLKQIDPERDFFDLSYLLSYVKYHAMWAEEDFSLMDNVNFDGSDYMGFFMRRSLSLKPKDQEPVVYDTEYYEELDPIAEESLYELLDYIEQKDLNVLFVNTPNVMLKQEVGRSNTVCKILDEYGINYLNCCETDDQGNFTYVIDLDHVHDFYNRNHLNYYGAEKFTEVFATYLDENYGFEDHRSDEAVQKDWDGVYTKIKKQIKKWEKK